MKTLLALALILISTLVNAAEIKIGWRPNSEPDIDHYILHWGDAPGNYTNHVNVPPDTVQDIEGAPMVVAPLDVDPALVTYIAVTAVNTYGLESLPSDELVYGPPARPSLPVVLIIGTDGSVTVIH